MTGAIQLMSKNKKMSEEQKGGLLSGILAPLGDVLSGGPILRAQKRSEALADRQHFEEYNSPEQQVKRLREAGLPLATMFNDSGVSGQSAMPDTSQVNPIGGNIDNLGSTILNNQLLREKVEQERVITDIKEEELRDLRETNKFNYDNGIVRDGELVTNKFRALEYDLNIKEYNKFIKENEKMMSDIDREVKQALQANGVLTEEVVQKVDKMINENNLLRQAFRDIEQFNEAKRVLIEEFQKGGMSAFEAAMYQLISGQIRMPSLMPR